MQINSVASADISAEADRSADSTHLRYLLFHRYLRIAIVVFFRGRLKPHGRTRVDGIRVPRFTFVGYVVRVDVALRGNSNDNAIQGICDLQILHVPVLCKSLCLSLFFFNTNLLCYFVMTKVYMYIVIFSKFLI